MFLLFFFSFFISFSSFFIPFSLFFLFFFSPSFLYISIFIFSFHVSLLLLTFYSSFPSCHYFFIAAFYQCLPAFRSLQSSSNYTPPQSLSFYFNFNNALLMSASISFTFTIQLKSFIFNHPDYAVVYNYNLN